MAVGCLIGVVAHAQGVSCIQSASSRQAFTECAQAEILPLESKVVHLVNELRSRHKADRKLLEAIEASDDAWNRYRNAQCSAESMARGGAPEVEVQRVFATCTKRELEARIKELEAF